MIATNFIGEGKMSEKELLIEEDRKPVVGDNIHSLLYGAGKVTQAGDTNVSVRYINGNVTHMIKDIKFHSDPTDKSQDYFKVDYVVC